MGNRIHILYVCVCVLCHIRILLYVNNFVSLGNRLHRRQTRFAQYFWTHSLVSLGFFIWPVCMIRLQINQYNSWSSAIFNFVLYDDTMISPWLVSARPLGLPVTFACARRWTWTHFRKNRLICSGVSSGFFNCQSIPVQQDVPRKYNFGTSPFSSR